jgi:hypothetical protein
MKNEKQITRDEAIKEIKSLKERLSVLEELAGSVENIPAKEMSSLITDFKELKKYKVEKFSIVINAEIECKSRMADISLFNKTVHINQDFDYKVKIKEIEGLKRENIAEIEWAIADNVFAHHKSPEKAIEEKFKSLNVKIKEMSKKYKVEVNSIVDKIRKQIYK